MGMHELVLRGRGPNTLTVSSLRELEQQVDAHAGEALLIRGHGKAFSAGLDLDALALSHPKELLDAMDSVARKLFLHPAPTVACINGHAIAGGCLIAQCCDYRVAADVPGLKMGMTAVALGLSYPPLVFRILCARIPTHSVDRVLLDARLVDARQALSYGLVDALEADVLEAARAQLTYLSKLPREAYVTTKRALRRPHVEVGEAEQEKFQQLVLQQWVDVLARIEQRKKP